ncbi:MAG: helix-turn-helix transcriptional regulator [Deferribacteraceae bacterium]|jgi:transcriptional regulator with XRE-family HTH domain|nr:helix-turn-helix transcriptional regulator [Deferribacteraceae bacterium]
MIGKKLKELIKKRNIKQIVLAKHVGISPSRLSNYLSDKREPDLDMLAKMAKFLGKDLNFFSDVEFDTPPLKPTYEPKVEESNAREDGAYISEIAGAVCVPYLAINSKKRAAKARAVPVWEGLVNGVDNPQDNVVLFEVTTGIGDENFRQGDYIVAKKFDKEDAINGALVFETGRNGRIYKYIKEAQILVSGSASEITKLSDKDISGFYTIVWVIKKP